MFKSKKVLNKNLDIFSSVVTNINRNKLSKDMWSNYGKTFIEYVFLNNLKKTIYILILMEKII